MAIQIKNFLNVALPAAQTTQFQCPAGAKLIIDKVTGVNQFSANCNVSVNLVDFGDAPTNSNLVVKERTIAPGETYTFPELVGQVLEEGDYFSTLCSLGTSITMRVSGREIT